MVEGELNLEKKSAEESGNLYVCVAIQELTLSANLVGADDEDLNLADMGSDELEVRRSDLAADSVASAV